jgi:primase-polymerase (primpol)-like protein
MNERAQFLEPDLRRLSALSAELGHRRHWCCWRGEPVLNDDSTHKRDARGHLKWSKRPRRPTGFPASHSDPRTWSHFAECAAALSDPRLAFDGIGIVLAAADPFTGVDLDGCVERGVLEPWAETIVRDLDGYAELSPSGRGVRILVRGSIGAGRKKGDIEVYSTLRFLTLTGSTLPGSTATIPDRQAQLDEVVLKIFGPIRTTEPEVVAPIRERATAEDLRLLLLLMDLDPRVRALYMGDWQAVMQGREDRSRSAADAVFVGLLHSAGFDPGRIQRIMRSSRMNRPKYSESRGSTDYLGLTVAKVVGHLEAEP